jgi:hypothetical protein
LLGFLALVPFGFNGPFVARLTGFSSDLFLVCFVDVVEVVEALEFDDATEPFRPCVEIGGDRTETDSESELDELELDLGLDTESEDSMEPDSELTFFVGLDGRLLKESSELSSALDNTFKVARGFRDCCFF